MTFSGVFAPLPTPFGDDDQVDVARLRAALARWVATPLTGFIVLGSNGEAVLLDEEEADRVVAAARDEVPRGRPLIVGTGRESTRAAIRASKRAASLGADAVIVRTPGFFRSQMTCDAFVRHYTAVADASPVPILLYNFTAVTGVDLPVAAALRLAEHPNVVGMKESNGDIGKVAELASSAPPSFQVLTGSTTVLYAALSVGAVGGILAVSGLLPDACVRLFEMTKAGRHGDALALQRRLAPIARLLGPVYGVPGLKAALSLEGYDVGGPRPPLVPLPEADRTVLREAIARFHRHA
jgi:4-hydroxy-2-oxoglutarate aldolase